MNVRSTIMALEKKYLKFKKENTSDTGPSAIGKKTPL
jgi:hypothetical protein